MKNKQITTEFSKKKQSLSLSLLKQICSKRLNLDRLNQSPLSLQFKMRTQSPQKNQLVRGSRSKLKRKKYRKIKNFFNFSDKDKPTYSTPKLLNKNLKNAQSTIWLSLALRTSQIKEGPYYTSSVHKVSVKIVRQSYLEPKSCKV